MAVQARGNKTDQQDQHPGRNGQNLANASKVEPANKLVYLLPQATEHDTKPPNALSVSYW